jgi:uncharacterized protein (DUF2141 family)
MRASFAALALALLAGTPAFAARSNLAVTLHVTVDGVKPGAGPLRVGLHDEATFSIPDTMPLLRQDIAKVAGEVSLQFERLPPGSYALKAYQDLNNDGKWDPGEPKANSNGAQDNDFDAAALVLMPGVADAVLHLR